MELSGKQKSYLRGLAQTIKPLFQIGKDGLTEAIRKNIRDYLLKNELMKISILETAPEHAEDYAPLFEEMGMCVVQIIGRQVVLYKRNPKLEDGIVLPK
jgi:RNA-binding protein